MLPEGPAAVTHEVHLAGVAPPLRLAMQRLPPAQSASQAGRARWRVSKQGHRLGLRTVRAARYLILLTSLPVQKAGAAKVVELYRAYWQIELGFKH